MLSSFTRDLAGAPDGYDAFFLVESFPETLGHAVILHILVNLNNKNNNKNTHQSLEPIKQWLHLLRY